MGASGLGSLLVKEGFLTEQDRQTITKTCGQGSWAFAKSIVAMGLLDEDELAAFFAERTRYQIAPKDFLKNLDQSAVQSLDRRLLSKLEMIPLRRDSGRITVGVVDPLDRATLKQLEFFTGLEVDPVVVPLSQLYQGLHKIDPDFRLQPTALTHFLQNHAQSAWVRQKLDTETARGGTLRPLAAKITNSDEELFEEVTEDEEIEEPIEMEELPEDFAEEEGEIKDASEEEFSEIDDEPITPEEEDSNEDNDPFGGVTDLDSSAGPSKKIAKELEHELNPFEDAEIENKDQANDREIEVSDLDIEEEGNSLSGTLLDRLNDDEETPVRKKAVPISNDDEDFKKLKSPRERMDEALVAADNASDALSKDSADKEFSVDEDEDEYAMPEVSTFGFEETKPRGMPKREESKDEGLKSPSNSLNDDVLDVLDDHDEPSLDISALNLDQEDDEERLLDDLSPSDSEQPLSKLDGPSFDIDESDWSPHASKKREFSDGEEEETSINLKPTIEGDDDDDIQLHPSSTPKKELKTAQQKTTVAAAAPREHKDSGLNPTSVLNEIMLKLSLSFGSDSSRSILEEFLPQIGRAGCLLNLVDQRQILWNDGQLIKEQLGQAAIRPMETGSSEKKWKLNDLKADESWTGEAIKLRVYLSGEWLWAHSLSEANDSAIFRETVESVVNQAQEKLGAG